MKGPSCFYEFEYAMTPTLKRASSAATPWKLSLKQIHPALVSTMLACSACMESSWRVQLRRSRKLPYTIEDNGKFLQPSREKFRSCPGRFSAATASLIAAVLANISSRAVLPRAQSQHGHHELPHSYVFVGSSKLLQSRHLWGC